MEYIIGVSNPNELLGFADGCLWSAIALGCVLIGYVFCCYCGGKK